MPSRGPGEESQGILCYQYDLMIILLMLRKKVVGHTNYFGTTCVGIYVSTAIPTQLMKTEIDEGKKGSDLEVHLYM